MRIKEKADCPEGDKCSEDAKINFMILNYYPEILRMDLG